MYFLSIEDNGDTVVLAYGDLDEINFIGRRRAAALALSAHEFTVRLADVGRIDGGQGARADIPADIKRVITEFSGDGDTAAVVLKRKLAAERRQAIELVGPGTERLQQETSEV